MAKPNPAASIAPLRPPAQVMRLARLGASFPTRLSFMRSLLRRLSCEKAQVSRPVWQIDDQGFGQAVYSVDLGGYTYSLVAFSTPLSDDDRTDRVIAEAWDTTYVLFDGTPTAADLKRLAANAPKQEAGRFSDKELVLCRANKSVRMFQHVVECLAAGHQPSPQQVQDVGYLMRTTAVYGNGKFGIADRARFADRPGMSGPFHAEMLAVWLVRGFTHDLVEHVARTLAPLTFTPLDPGLKRHLGIGNATGLGMAPFLVNHPILLNNWVLARETALARVLGLTAMSRVKVARVTKLIDRVTRHLNQWNVADRRQLDRVLVLRQEWSKVAKLVTEEWLSKAHPWTRLVELADSRSVEFQELMVALVLEVNGDLIDDLADGMSASGQGRFNTAMTVGEMRKVLAKHFDWALGIDFAQPDSQRLFWYVSEEKAEPRLGDRYAEAGADIETRLDIARQAQDFANSLDTVPDNVSIAEFLTHHPQHRSIARRAQSASAYPYAELRDNLIAADCMPIDMLRCKLAFFGAAKFDPKSDRWTRITMYQGAPLFGEISGGGGDDWWLPVLAGAG